MISSYFFRCAVVVVLWEEVGAFWAAEGCGFEDLQGEKGLEPPITKAKCWKMASPRQNASG